MNNKKGFDKVIGRKDYKVIYRTIRNQQYSFIKETVMIRDFTGKH